MSFSADNSRAQENGAGADALTGGGGGGTLPAPLLRREPWIAARIHAGLALAGAVVAAVITTVSVFAGALIADPDVAGVISPYWFPFLVQSLGMGFAGALGTSGSIMGVNFTVAVFVFPLIVPVTVVLSVILFGRRLAPEVSLTPTWRILPAAASGVAFAIVVVLLQAIAPLSITVPTLPDDFTARAISGWSVLLSIVVVGVAAFVASLPRGTVRGRWRAAATQAVEHLGVVGAVLAIAVFLYAVVKADDGGTAVGLLLLAPLLLPLLAVDASGLASGGSVMASTRGTVDDLGLEMFGGLPDDVANASQSLWMFSGILPVWVRVVVPLVTLAAIAVASVRWRVRRGTADDVVSWLLLPVAYGVFGLVALLVGRVSASVRIFAGGNLADMFGDAGGRFGVSAGLGLASWSFVLMALVGLAVEVVARFAVPAVAPSIPRGALRALAAGASAATPAAPQATATAGGGPSSAAPTAGPAVPGAPASSFADASTESPAPAPDVPAGDPAAHAPASEVPAGDPAAPREAQQDDALTAILGEHAARERPANPGAKTAWIVGGSVVAGVVVLAVAGTVVRGYLAETRFSPAVEVEAYLQHVVDGKAEAAIELWGPNVTTGERVLLTDAVYGAAEGRPTSYEILDSEITDETAIVTASVEVDGKDYESTFSLVADGTQALVFDAWRITGGPLQSIALGDVSSPVTVNGAEVELGDVASAADDGFTEQDALTEQALLLPVLPGRYTFAAPADDGVFTYGGDVTRTVLPGESAQASGEPVSFEAHWKEEAQQKAIDIVQERIDLCMTSDYFQPSDCKNVLGMSEPFYAVTDLERSWEDEPTLTFVEGDEDPADAVVRVEGGTLAFHYKWRYDDDDEWEDGDDVDPFPFGGWFSSGIDLPVSVGDDGEVFVDFSEF